MLFCPILMLVSKYYKNYETSVIAAYCQHPTPPWSVVCWANGPGTNIT